jgi:hypothetical protein
MWKWFAIAYANAYTFKLYDADIGFRGEIFRRSGWERRKSWNLLRPIQNLGQAFQCYGSR